MSNLKLAHVRENEEGSFDEQPLIDHLKEVAELAGDFASDFGAGDWAYLIGALHDVGKATCGWQLALRRETGYDPDAFIETRDDGEGKGNHSSLGAVAMHTDGSLGRTQKVLAYVVAGHHAGLPDWEPGDIGDCLIKRLFAGDVSAGVDKKLKEQLKTIAKDPETDEFLSSLTLPKTPFLSNRRAENPDPEAIHLWIRMLFSCVVDADYLNTEEFMSPDKHAARGRYASIKELKERLDSFMYLKSSAARPCNVNKIRAQVLESCREKAKFKPGIFTLSVPTGAGKTLASMAFALDHALMNGKKRVIVAIPYTSIIEQTAKVYKYGTDSNDEISVVKDCLFGEENVIEHHSNVDPEKETQRSRLASENWDAPIIVTTNVQLFESLAGSRPSVCRKLHNLANSVIVLDEVQLLPTEYLHSILRNLEHLVEYFGVTVLMCTATQPALTGIIGEGNDMFHGLASTVEIYDQSRKELFGSLKRVEFIVASDNDRYEDWQPLANELSEIGSVLCVVNTRQSAHDLHSLMPKGTFHLSGLMCGEDRSDVISQVKLLLKTKGEVRLISTQLIEAGVDVDFLVVYRAFAGMDSIVQSAGRCNREGRLNPSGVVKVFNAPIKSPRGLLAKGEDTARSLLRGKSSFELSDDLFERYFREFFRKVRTFDKPDAKGLMLLKDGAIEYQFRSYAHRYRLIDDQSQRPILVPYRGKTPDSDGEALIDRLERRCDYQLMRRLQRFTVNVPERVYTAMDRNGMLHSVGEGRFATLSDPKYYRPGIGLSLDDEAYSEALII